MTLLSRRDTRRLRTVFENGTPAERAEALGALEESLDPQFASLLVEVVDEGRLDHGERARALRLLADLGLAFALDTVRADGWLERLGEGVAGFREACDILGRNFLGLATLLGVQVTAIEVHPEDFDRTRVGFGLGDGRTEELPLREFKRRLVTALLEDEPVLPEVQLPLDHDRAIKLLGSRHLLLAALYDWSLRWVYFPAPPRKLRDVRIEAVHGGMTVAFTLEAFVRRLHEEVQAEWDRYLDPLGGIDADRIRRAAAFLPKEPAKVIETLGGLLRFVLDAGRRPDPRPPDRISASLLCEGLALLGRAHLAVQPEHNRFGEEILRLGMQVLPGAGGLHHLHLALGEFLVRTGREAEAVAHLRRADVLGASADQVEPLLVEAYFRIGRRVAASVLCERLARRAPAAAERIPAAVVEALRADAAPVFEALGSLDASEDTLPPPPPGPAAPEG